MLAYGFTIDTLVELINAGLATLCAPHRGCGLEMIAPSSSLHGLEAEVGTSDRVRQ
jgi:hypothetical protein